MGQVPVEALRPLLGLRLRVRPGASWDPEESVLRIPRKGRVERWVARLFHGETRVRLALDERGGRVLEALTTAEPATPAELGQRLGITVPDDGEPAEAWSEEAVSLVLFLGALVRGRGLVTEPI